MMKDAVKQRIKTAADKFYEEAYKEGEDDVTHENIATVLLGVAYNRFKAAGITLPEVIEILKKCAGS